MDPMGSMYSLLPGQVSRVSQWSPLVDAVKEQLPLLVLNRSVYLEPKWGPLFCFEFRPCFFSGLTLKNGGQLGSRYILLMTFYDISSLQFHKFKQQQIIQN